MLNLMAFLKGLGYGMFAVVIMPILIILSFKEIKNTSNREECKGEGIVE